MMKDYSLIVIEQEKVPLAAAPAIANNPFWVILVVMLAVAMVICMWRYLTQCRIYRKRIQKLDPGGEAYLGWNIRRLEQTTEELELDTDWVLEKLTKIC